VYDKFVHFLTIYNILSWTKITEEFDNRNLTQRSQKNTSEHEAEVGTYSWIKLASCLGKMLRLDALPPCLVLRRELLSLTHHAIDVPLRQAALVGDGDQLQTSLCPFTFGGHLGDTLVSISKVTSVGSTHAAQLGYR